MISYEDFDLRIQADGEEFVVSAHRGTQSTNKLPFELDLSPFLDLWERGEQGSIDTRELGSALFDALIRESIRDLYHQGRGSIGGDAAKGLRIRILLDPRDERLRPLLRVPWEILLDRSADMGGLVALDPQYPIVRAIESTEQTRSPAPGPLQRVLLAMSRPRHLRSLDLEIECARVQKALEGVSVHPEILRHATRSNLYDCICDGEHQIVHFMGHGRFDPSVREGVLLLEHEDRVGDVLSASALASFFAGKPMPRLVILASCYSAHSGPDPNSIPFASVAAALIAVGLPAVVAMQTSVRDRSAIRFIERLYERIAKGDPVEAAVSQARNVLREGEEETLDWAVPVLYVRERPGGALIQQEPAAPASSPSSQVRGVSVGFVVNNNGNVGPQVNSERVDKQINNFSWGDRQE